MQLSINKEKGIVSIECSDNIIQDDAAINNLLKIINTLESNCADKTISTVDLQAEFAKFKTPTNIHTISGAIERTTTRLPNINEKESKVTTGSNIIDLNNKTIKQPFHGITAYRCPKCGQSHIIKVDKNYIIRNSDNETYILHEFEGKYSYDRVVNSDIVIDLNTKGTSVLVSDNVEEQVYKGECPICGHSNSTNLWEAAWNNREAYFEYEPCPICGTEMSFIKFTDNNKQVLECENEKCKHTEEF